MGERRSGPPARPQRVLAAGRRLQDRRTRRPGRRARHAGARPHRPRRDERLCRALQGVQGGGGEADHRDGGLPGRRPEAHPAGAALRAEPPHPARLQRRGLPEPRQAELRRLPRGLLEGQRNGVAEQDKANGGIVRIARELGRPLVATADVHYLRREDYDSHAALLCVQTKSTIEQPKLRFDTNEFYLKSPGEMSDSFSDLPEAVASTLEIAERCDLEIKLGQLLLPRFPTPTGVDPGEMLRELAGEGLRRRYGDPIPADAQERLEFELGVVSEMGFESYFLIVWDFVRYAKGEGIAVGPGRGSAAGSIVAYALEITDIDPLANDLLFE